MTRRREMMLEDITECKHEPEIPVTEDDGFEIIYWICRCGRRIPIPETKEDDVNTQADNIIQRGK